ncbi:MAG: glycosyltransferase [Flavobacteriales bacterium]|nr:glycosyltransferase [Flavobacteriales bacterium]
MEKLKHASQNHSKPMVFSILIPTWNNLPYLQLCIASIQEYSAFNHQIIVHVNEGVDGTLAWLKQQGIEFTYTPQNVGVCIALNMAYKLAKHDYILYMNDDMVPLPGWDTALVDMITQFPSNAFYLSSTMIEPEESANNCVLSPFDYGRTPELFQKEKLLKEYSSLLKPHWCGATWPPSLVHREFWDKVGGYSEEFSPGLYSDPDFSMKLWQAGVRYFVGVGNSKVYHFMSKSTGRVKLNNGRKQFVKKWGITASFFKTHYLQMGKTWLGTSLPQSPSKILTFLHRMRVKLSS